MAQRDTQTAQDSNCPAHLQGPDVEALREQWTPKQRTNWEDHGKPIYEALGDEEARTWYLRLLRPKKQGSGMMDRDHVKTGTPEQYLRKSIEHFKRPRTSIHGMVMASLGTSEEQREMLDEVAARIVAAQVEAGDISKAAARRIIQNNKRVAALYGGRE